MDELKIDQKRKLGQQNYTRHTQPNLIYFLIKLAILRVTFTGSINTRQW